MKSARATVRPCARSHRDAAAAQTFFSSARHRQTPLTRFRSVALSAYHRRFFKTAAAELSKKTVSRFLSSRPRSHPSGSACPPKSGANAALPSFRTHCAYYCHSHHTKSATPRSQLLHRWRDVPHPRQTPLCESPRRRSLFPFSPTTDGLFRPLPNRRHQYTPRQP